ncbi:hypothetical protein GCM10011502_22950 [Oceanisphaera marina]|uniref:Secreted protein n=1 Tax=Oceanisphaera marina TaxID=2017550 RepID=A0ABQ1IPH8_9GAMM|nr:hypothetical protein [Oceanisphaera marina]GGB49087.1 hypothetical protein GCM10011502_22950 [Oceanisphaera marina]
MRTLLSTVLLTALLGLTACEPKGPAADIGDNIDQVLENQAAADSQLRDEAAAATQSETVSAPEPEVIEQQKEEIAIVTEEASQEAEQRLNEILENTIEQP